MSENPITEVKLKHINFLTTTEYNQIEEHPLDELYAVETATIIQTSPSTNTNSWYRVYSDGFCIQGGQRTSSGSVSLPKVYNNTNYRVTFGEYNTASSNTLVLIYDKNFDSFKINVSSGTMVDWTAYGYIS